MTVQDTTPRSRRSVITAAAAAGLGTFVGLFGGPRRVDAGVDGDVVLGAANAAGATTSIDAPLSGATVSIGNSGAGPALSLTASGGGPAILTGGSANLTSTSPVLFVNSNDGSAPLVKVLAEVAPAMLLGYPESQAGLLVYGGTTPPVTLPTDVAVYASANDAFVGAGTGPSRAVVGDAGSGTGVTGSTVSGVGLHAIATGAAGTALSVSGKAQFSRSGRIGITTGHATATKTLAGVTTKSLIIAVLQTYRAGYYVVAAVPAAGKFTIHLNKSVAATAYVAYFVIN